MISFPRGNTHTLQVTITFDDPINAVNGPMDLAGAGILLFVKKTDAGAAVLTIPGVVYGLPATGVVRFTFLPSDTDLLATGAYRYCVDVTRPSLDVYTVQRDTIELLPH